LPRFPLIRSREDKNRSRLPVQDRDRSAVKLVLRLAVKGSSAHACTRYPGRATNNGGNKRNTSNSSKRESFSAFQDPIPEL